MHVLYMRGSVLENALTLSPSTVLMMGNNIDKISGTMTERLRILEGKYTYVLALFQQIKRRTEKLNRTGTDLRFVDFDMRTKSMDTIFTSIIHTLYMMT